MFTTKSTFLLLFPLLSLSLTKSVTEQHVKIGLYYECLCPYSVEFVVDQLFPTWQLFGSEMISLDLKPFGKANFTSDGESWTFVCQHGPGECLGNTVQACVLNQVLDPGQYVPLINCMMGADYPPDSADVCLETLQVTTTSPERVSECVDSSEGPNLLHDIGVETKNLDPPLTGVPWILFNDEFDNDDWNAAMGDLKSLLCSKFLTESDKC